MEVVEEKEPKVRDKADGNKYVVSNGLFFSPSQSDYYRREAIVLILCFVVCYAYS
jgi:hypothetical protein